MRVYLAAAYSARDTLRELWVPIIRLNGHECTSTWLAETAPITPGTVGAALDRSPEYIAKHIAGDINDIDRSDALILLTESFMRSRYIPGPYNTGGRHVEVGVALALGIPVIVVGEPENIFQRGCPIVPTLTDAINLLSEIPTRTPQTEGAF